MPWRRVGPCAVTWPGAGNEYEPFVHASPGQSMKRARTKLGRMPRYIFSRAATWFSIRDLGRHSRHCSAAGPPEKHTSAAPAPAWPSVPSHVMWMRAVGERIGRQARPGARNGSSARSGTSRWIPSAASASPAAADRTQMRFQTLGGAVSSDVLGFEHTSAGQRHAREPIGDAARCAPARSSTLARCRWRWPACARAADCRPCSDTLRCRSSTSRARHL